MTAAATAAAGVLHQVDAGHATRNRQAVGFGHFGGGEEFESWAAQR